MRISISKSSNKEARVFAIGTVADTMTTKMMVVVATEKVMATEQLHKVSKSISPRVVSTHMAMESEKESTMMAVETTASTANVAAINSKKRRSNTKRLTITICLVN